jgi:hypothetical protein
MADNVEQNKDSKRVEPAQTSTNEYPHNHVFTTKGGIRVSYGDEKGKQFFRMEHPSGQYTEIYPDGKSVTMNVGDNKQYNKGGMTISVDENNDVHIHGHNHVKVGGGAHIEVVGNAGIAVGGDTALVGVGNLNFDVDNCYMGIRGDMGMRVSGNMKFKVDGNVEITNDGTMDLASGGTRTDVAPLIRHNP